MSFLQQQNFRPSFSGIPGISLCLLFLLLCVFTSVSFAQLNDQSLEQEVTPETTAVVHPTVTDHRNNLQSQHDQAIITYQEHRLEFENRKKNIADEVQQELLELEDEIRSLKAELEAGQKHLDSAYQIGRPQLPTELEDSFQLVRQKTSRYRNVLSGLTSVNRGTAVVLSPWAIIAGPYAEKILFVFLPITVLNIFIFLYFRQKDVFFRHKKTLIILLVTVILASATSLMAAPADKKRMEVEEKLRYAEDMMLLTGNQKAIAILESKRSKQINLPSGLSYGDLKLPIYKNISIDSPEYYITLAGLYLAEEKTGKAIEAMTNIAEKRALKGNPNNKIILSTVKFLVENGYSDIAGTAVTNHAELLYDTRVLLDLAEYLKTNSMQVSSAHVMNLVEEKTKSTVGLVELAGYFYNAGKTDKAVKILLRGLNRSKDIADIILIAKACLRQQAKSVFEKIPTKEKKLSGNTEQLLELAKIYNDQGESSQVTIILRRAVSTSSSVVLLKKVALAVVEFKQDPVMDNVIAKVIQLAQKDLGRSPDSEQFKKAYKHCLRFVDFFIKENRQENAVKLFNNTTEKVKKSRRKDGQYISLMLNLSREALRRNFKKQAEKIIFTLSYVDIKPRRDAFKTYIEFHQNLLDSIYGVPERSRLSIPLLAGLINEDIDQLGKTEQIYMQAVELSLESLNKSYGETIPDTLNEFFLLGRLWQKENRVNVLASLDRVYTLIEKRILENIKEQERQRIMAEPNSVLMQLKAKRESQLASIQENDAENETKQEEYSRQQQQMINKAQLELAEKEKELNALTIKVVLKVLSSLIIQIVLIGLLIGCVVLAWKYSQRMKEHKVYGFVTRFIELNGWLRVLSMLGVLSGFLLILVSQFLQMFQKIHELTLQGFQKASYTPITISLDEKKKAIQTISAAESTKRKEDQIDA